MKAILYSIFCLLYSTCSSQTLIMTDIPSNIAVGGRTTVSVSVKSFSNFNGIEGAFVAPPGFKIVASTSSALNNFPVSYFIDSDGRLILAWSDIFDMSLADGTVLLTLELEMVDISLATGGSVLFDKNPLNLQPPIISSVSGLSLGVTSSGGTFFYTGGGGGGTQLSNQTINVPIDNGVIFLVIVGLLYGIYAFKKSIIEKYVKLFFSVFGS